MSRSTLIGCVASGLLSAATPAVSDVPAPPVGAVMAQLPLRFEANQGQFDPAVKFAARTSTYTLAIKQDGVSLQFAGAPAVSLSLAHSSPAPELQPLDRQALRTDYMVGARDSWHTGIANYSKIRYSSVYPGIDMVFYGTERRLEYDFVVAPGANPDSIRLHFQGAGPLRITTDGDLALDTPAGVILQKQPIVYQDDAKTGARRPISARYRQVAGGMAAIQLGAYDHSRALVIDPILTYSTLIGGSGTDSVAAMKYQNGLLYIAGTTGTGTLTSTDLPYNAQHDTFIEVIDMTRSTGPKIKYFTYLGGSGADNTYGMDVDPAGFIYVVGQTASTDYPIVGTAVQTTGSASTTDAFLSKIDPNQAGNGNSLVYSTYLGGTLGNDIARSVAVGANGVAYMFGTTQSADFPVTDNAYATSLYGPSDCFLAKIDTLQGVLMFSSYIGSEVDDDGRAIVLAPNGLVYFAATTAGTQFPLAGPAYNGFPVGDYDIIIGAFDLTKSGLDTLVYGTYFGGSLNDEIRGMALDGHGRLILTGYTLSPDFPITARTAVQPTYLGNGDAFVSLVDMTQAAGNFLVYSTFLGGTDGDVGYGVAADANGYLYVTGYTLSSDFPRDDNAIQPNWGGGTDMFITRINPNKALKAGIDYSTYIGLDGTIVGCCLALGNDGSLYVGGSTEGYLPLINNPIQVAYGGGYTDGFLLVVSPAAGATGSEPNSQRRPETPRVVPGKGAPANGVRPRMIQ